MNHKGAKRKNLQSSNPQQATNQSALEARALCDVLKYLQESRVYDLFYQAESDIRKMTPKLAEAMTSYLLGHGMLPSAGQLAIITGQPHCYCRFMLIHVGNQIKELVSKAHKGQSAKSILYKETTEQIEERTWVHDAMGKGENYIWDEDYFRSMSEGHYETTVRTVKRTTFLIDVCLHVLHRLDALCDYYLAKNTGIRVITPELLDDIVEKDFQL